MIYISIILSLFLLDYILILYHDWGTSENKINNTTDPLTYVTSSVNSIFISYVSENEITEVIQSLKKIVVQVMIRFWPVLSNYLIQYYIKPLTRLINS